MTGGGGCHSFLGACSLKHDASEFGSPSSLLPFQSLFTLSMDGCRQDV